MGWGWAAGCLWTGAHARKELVRRYTEKTFWYVVLRLPCSYFLQTFQISPVCKLVDLLSRKYHHYQKPFLSKMLGPCR